ncbi:MAG: hypothetical protein P1P84_25140, partial [Deferrisomatales bacterium]|nr:hypothetical protein [Deferrisomatales bacterium]
MATKFQSPHDVPAIPGTEGWERMYPYHYQFSKDDPERAKHESDQLWFYDGLHYPEPHYPFDLIWDEAWFLALSQNNTRTFLMPPALGIDHRIVNGHVYITPVGIANPEEIGERVPVFMKRAGYYYENWDSLYAEWKVKVNKLLADLEAVTFQPLPEVEDESVVFQNTGTGSGYHLLTQYDDLINKGLTIWQYHFEFLNLGYAAFLTFINTANSIFPDIPIQTLTKMVSGIDVVLYRPDAELIRLAKIAIENKLEGEILKQRDAEAMMAALATTTAGKYWLDELEKSRYPWFWVSTGTGWYHHHKSWNDDLNVPFASIRMHIEALKAGKQVGRPTEKLKAESERLVAEYRDLIETDEDREAFDQALGMAAKVFPYVEDHCFYVENWFHSVFWNKMRQVGDILAGARFIEDREDIWYLKRGEVRDALWDHVTSWATGVKGRGPSYWPKEIDWRRGVLEKFHAWTPPPALGTPPEVVTEPFSIMLWGVTTGTLKN